MPQDVFQGTVIGRPCKKSAQIPFMGKSERLSTLPAYKRYQADEKTTNTGIEGETT